MQISLPDKDAQRDIVARAADARRLQVASKRLADDLEGYVGSTNPVSNGRPVRADQGTS